jgi:hypothetical protein
VEVAGTADVSGLSFGGVKVISAGVYHVTFTGKAGFHYGLAKLLKLALITINFNAGLAVEGTLSATGDANANVDTNNIWGGQFSIKGSLKGQATLKIVATLGLKVEFAFNNDPKKFIGGAGIYGELNIPATLRQWDVAIDANPFSVKVGQPDMSFGKLTGELGFYWYENNMKKTNPWITV